MKLKLLALAGLVAVMGLSQPAYTDDDDDDGGNSLRFRSDLSGAQEVPVPVVTRTTGRIRIDFDRGLTKADFRLRVNDGEKVTQAHIHCGRAGVNGPVVAFLFGFVPGGVDVDGRLARGTLTNEDIIERECAVTMNSMMPMPPPHNVVQVNNIASLAFAAREGLLYVNVHTVANPPGEVRGQLLER